MLGMGLMNCLEINPKRPLSNLPDISKKPRYNFLRHRKMSFAGSKPKRSHFTDSRLNLESNLIILPLKACNESDALKKDENARKLQSSHLLSRHIFSSG